MTLAPEHELVAEITTPEQKAEIEAYIEKAKAKSERERMADVKTVSGAFTGAYAVHPFSGEPIPIWIGDYVLAGYGTGAVMAVPSGDQRDWSFATHFGIPIPAVIEGSNLEEEANESKDGILMNSDFLNGMKVKDAIKAAIAKLEEKGIGEGKINYRQRDAVFGRQRYWGEPIPIYYKDGVPYPINKLPLELPEVEKYLPTEDGDPPLGNAENWNWNPETEEIVANGEGYPIELSTMPGWAGSSWYYLRYMDPTNDEAFCGKEALKYWDNVDYYAGGAEHATGHLLYVRFWTKFLKDLGYLPFDEPAEKLVNQGMIQGDSRFAYRVLNRGLTSEVFISKDLFDRMKENDVAAIKIVHSEIKKAGGLSGSSAQTNLNGLWVSHDVLVTKIHVDVSLVEGLELDIDAFRNWRAEYSKAKIVPNEDGKFICLSEVEKMSKSKFNVVNPDDVIARYGADTLRLYEMFLGPLEDAKPWNTNGIEGVSRFLKKFWNMFHDGDSFSVSEEELTKKELKALHATIKKVQEDIERLSFNTCVSQFMICVNELNDLKCNKRAILEPLTVVVSTYAPHICEEIWSKLGHSESITFAEYPEFNESYLVEDSVNYPISFNGKTRLNLELPASMGKDEVEQFVLANEEVQQRLEGATPKKVIVVPKRIVNIVV
jgi:leucyl-tRNA synthetase